MPLRRTEVVGARNADSDPQRSEDPRTIRGFRISVWKRYVQLIGWTIYTIALIGPPDIVGGGLKLIRFNGDYSIYRFSPATIRARWTELNKNRPHARKWVRFENACPKSGVYHPLTNRGSKSHLFGRLRNSTAKFNGLYLPNETWYRQPGKHEGYPTPYKLGAQTHLFDDFTT